MTQEDKELLLKDLCARLPYDVMINYESHIYILNEIDPACKDIDYITVRIQDVERLMCAESVMLESIKPYLRPMSSMTEEEYVEYSKLWNLQDEFSTDADIRLKVDVFDWLNKHHFDYRGLIEKGLALEAPEGMYNQNYKNMSYKYFPNEFSSYEDYVKYLKEKGFAIEVPEGMYNIKK